MPLFENNSIPVSTMNQLSVGWFIPAIAEDHDEMDLFVGDDGKPSFFVIPTIIVFN